MSTKSRTLLSSAAIGLLSAFFAVSAGAHAQDRFGEQLGLTDAQQESVAAIRAEFAPARDARKAQRDEVIALAKSGDVDGAAALAATQASDAVYQRAEMFRQLAEVLTPEQLAQMEEMHSSGERFKGRKQGQRHDQ